MNKKAKLVFIMIFSIFGSVVLFITILSLIDPNDNYEMGVDTLVNNLRKDTQNYENVNRGKLETYLGKTFTVTGPLYSYDPKNGQLAFDSIRMVVYGNLEIDNLSKKENEELIKIKRGFTAKIKGEFKKISNFIVINDSKLLKLYDDRGKYSLCKKTRDKVIII